MTPRRLSAAQEAIWFEEELQAEGRSNTGFFSVTISGAVREDLIRAACAAVVDRHATLRAHVRDDGGALTLGIREPGSPLAFGTAAAPCPRGAEIPATRSWRDQHGKRAWRLRAEPGIAFTLLRHGDGRRTLLVVVHHICFDGRSKFLFARDFVAALTALRAGRPHGLATAPFPAVAEADAGTVRRVREHWDSLDVPGIPPLNLPSGSEPATGTGSTAPFTIPAPMTRRLRALATDAGTTVFGGLLAGVATQLRAYGNERMVLSIPADISAPGYRDVIGLAVNVVPVHLAVHRDDSFQTVLETARAALARINDYRAVPFQKVAAGTTWATATRSLFSRLSMSYLRLPQELPGVDGLALDWDFVAPNSAETFEAMFHVRDQGDHLSGRLDYSRRALDAVAAADMTGHFEAVLRGALAHPDTPAHRLGALPADSIAVSLAAAPAGDSLAAIVAEQTARHPGRIAVDGPAGPVAYAELDLASLGLGEANGADPRWQADLLGRPARVLQLAPAGSAGRSREAVLAWANGGTLVVDPAAVADDAAAVRAAVVRYGVTTIAAPYRALRLLARAGAGDLPLTDVITPIQELLSPGALAAGLGSRVRVHGEYNAVAIDTWHAVADGQPYVPVLRHLAPGVRLTVRGPGLDILPIGLDGDLVLEPATGGEPVRTGDRARLDRSGALVFLGATAQTATWAGLSLNLPGIARYLAAHPDVDDVAVTAAGSTAAAHVTTRPGAALGVRELRIHLKSRSVPHELRLSKLAVEAAP